MFPHVLLNCITNKNLWVIYNLHKDIWDHLKSSMKNIITHSFSRLETFPPALTASMLSVSVARSFRKYLNPLTIKTLNTCFG